MKRPSLPFSMKRLRDIQRRSFAAQDGWIKRRVSSDNVFPFRRRVIAVRRIKRKVERWGWSEYVAIAVILLALAIMVLALN